MTLKQQKMRTPWTTYRYLDGSPSRDKFKHDFSKILKSKYIRHKDATDHDRYNCCQLHDPRNSNWKPWRYLVKFCIKRGLDDFAVRDYLEELWGRKLDCECQIIENPLEQHRRDIMRQFGADFEEMGDCGLTPQ